MLRKGAITLAAMLSLAGGGTAMAAQSLSPMAALTGTASAAALQGEEGVGASPLLGAGLFVAIVAIVFFVADSSDDSTSP